MSTTVEPVEAVIISGPRRGEIIRLDDPYAEVSDEEIRMLNDALDELIAAVDRLSTQVRATTAAFREKAEAA